MKERTTLKRISSLTPQEFRRCTRLTHGEDGQMASLLKDAKEKKRKRAVVVLAYHNSTIVSWCIYARASSYFNGENRYEAMFFTDKKYRGKGYATKVTLRLRKYLQLNKLRKPAVYGDRYDSFFRISWFPSISTTEKYLYHQKKHSYYQEKSQYHQKHLPGGDSYESRRRW